MKKHEKHTALKKPSGGRYHRVEIGFIGAPCGKIQTLSKAVVKSLKKSHNIGYMDADHGSGDETMDYNVSYTDKIGFHQLNYSDDHTEYTLRSRFQQCDCVLINANHFSSDAQIVIINEQKKDSLARKLDRLTRVVAFVLDDNMDGPFHFLKDSLSNYSEIPIIKISNLSAISELIHQSIDESRASLNGLLLYGGQSSRMGTDKGLISYHGVPQIEFLKQLLKESCEDTLISVTEKKGQFEDDELILDTFVGLGPYGGILSAFRKDPNKAYLSLPCDVPFINNELIQLLVKNRNPSKVATCFHNNETNFPEPLITIWEPRAYPILLDFLSKGYSCPRKVLINSDIQEIQPPNNWSLYNVNTPEEKKIAEAQIFKSQR